MARAVVPSTAAAVDHADTELIGHDGQPGDTGFLCSGFKEMISRLCAYFPCPKNGSKHNDTKREQLSQSLISRHSKSWTASKRSYNQLLIKIF